MYFSLFLKQSSPIFISWTNVHHVFGEFDERFPTSGFIELLGVDLEGAILSVVSKDEARVGIRAEGDTTGDGRPDFSQPVFLIDWLDFVDRDFKALP